MKLNEIVTSGKISVDRFFELLYIDKTLYEETPNGVNASITVKIRFDSPVVLSSLTHLPFQFNEIHGDFSVLHLPLETFDCVPRKTHGDLALGSTTSSRITSLIGISDLVKWIGPKSRLTGDAARIILPFTKITTGGIGLVMIDGGFVLDGLGYALPKPFQIIEKYLGRPDDIFECQAELIENGFEAFAVL